MGSTLVITVRLAEPVARHRLDDLRRTIRIGQDESLRRVECYADPRMEHDLAFNLVHESPLQTYGPSVLGQRLAAALEELGLVHTAIWVSIPGLNVRKEEP